MTSSPSALGPLIALLKLVLALLAVEKANATCTATIGNKLFASASELNWANAEAFCTARGGRLADVNDDTVWNLLNNYFSVDIYTALHNADLATCTNGGCVGLLRVCVLVTGSVLAVFPSRQNSKTYLKTTSPKVLLEKKTLTENSVSCLKVSWSSSLTHSIFRFAIAIRTESCTTLLPFLQRGWPLDANHLYQHRLRQGLRLRRTQLPG